MTEPESIRARWFDGRSSQAQPVLVRLVPGAKGPSLQLHPAAETGAAALQLAHHQVGWPERFSAHRAPPRLVADLGDHGSLEIDDAAAWHSAFAAAGARPPLAERMQTRWPMFLVVLLVAGAALWSFYRWGTPWAAVQITRALPLQWETSLSERALRDLDREWLKPSKLPADRQAQLRARFDALAASIAPELLRYPGYRPALRLEFRAAGFGPNAFALPGGTIVMTDEMVRFAAKRGLPDDALVGVLAHEIGHVMHRHTTRLVVEQGVLNVGLGLALGDVSTLVSVGASALTGLAYRRSHETEADCFSLALMQRAQLPTAPMADLLLGIDSPAADRAAPAWMSLLNSHPETRERARRLKESVKSAGTPDPVRHGCP